MTERQAVVFQGWPVEGKARADASRDRFRHNLARIMAERGISQAALARTMDVSRVAVHAWIWGTCFPETSRLLKLSQALNVPVGSLLEGEPEAGATDNSSSDEALLLDAFRKLPSNARRTLLADAHEMSMQFSVATAVQESAETAS